MKKRAFDASEAEASAPSGETSGETPRSVPRTEPAPFARAAIALVLASWIVPLWMLVSIVRYVEEEPDTMALHRGLTFASVALLGGGLGLSIRAIGRARADPRMRRRLAVAGLMLSLLTPVVWASELMFAWRMVVVRASLEEGGAAAEGDGSSPPGE
jgi:hypothetical protein